VHYIDTLGGRGVRKVRQLEAPVDAAVSETRQYIVQYEIIEALRSYIYIYRRKYFMLR
jgi:hypothetical protein